MDTTFDTMNLLPAIRRALETEEYTVPTPIQTQAIPPVLEGRDLCGIAQTGTGKTAAFAIPTLQRLAERPPQKRPGRPIRALILTPTRELALQVGERFSVYGQHLPLRTGVVFGGVSQKPQEETLRRGVDILVATPGRLLDLMQQEVISLRRVEILILDEADRMLDMGFLPDVRRIVKQVPTDRQTLFFSATMPDDITKLSASMLREPVRVAIEPEQPTVERIEQSLYRVDRDNKRHLLQHLLKDPAVESALVFTRTKHGADRVARDLGRVGIGAQAIHGNKSQSARQRTLAAFKRREIRVLVATDIAARGLDIDELSHVFNFDLPEVPEVYVHRIGRTGRAGLGGTAISFCDEQQGDCLRGIQKLLGRPLDEVTGHPYPATKTEEAPPASKAPARRRRRRR